MHLRIGSSGLVAAMALALLGADAAFAHGVQGRAETPIPVSAFFWAAAGVLVVSFAALALGWRKPLLTSVPWRPLPRRLNDVLRSRILTGSLRAITILGTLVVLGAALFGSTRLGDDTSSPILHRI
jgi:hypothetical protein